MRIFNLGGGEHLTDPFPQNRVYPTVHLGPLADDWRSWGHSLPESVLVTQLVFEVQRAMRQLIEIEERRNAARANHDDD